MLTLDAKRMFAFIRKIQLALLARFADQPQTRIRVCFPKPRYDAETIKKSA